MPYTIDILIIEPDNNYWKLLSVEHDRITSACNYDENQMH